MSIEHPMITQINATGYPSKDVEPKEIVGKDYFGNKIYAGDDVVEYEGKTILADSLDDYLIEVLGFEFKKAE
ncbi:hypothetical protein [Niallia sp. NCCP-28]|uniref:YqaI family protein n=1 Tax=Niallia sp. NCCP-28 TaxID=2934712 RepID=UPI00208063DE|nr:hypothetical protein [Niallia sp. NCCP-28]GKU81235.1 hypothetical protein NCCP28_06310 [Niallia sp. NCCP-28]